MIKWGEEQEREGKGLWKSNGREKWKQAFVSGEKGVDEGNGRYEDYYEQSPISYAECDHYVCQIDTTKNKTKQHCLKLLIRIFSATPHQCQLVRCAGRQKYHPLQPRDQWEEWCREEEGEPHRDGLAQLPTTDQVSLHSVLVLRTTFAKGQGRANPTSIHLPKDSVASTAPLPDRPGCKTSLVSPAPTTLLSATTTQHTTTTQSTFFSGSRTHSLSLKACWLNWYDQRTSRKPNHGKTPHFFFRQCLVM